MSVVTIEALANVDLRVGDFYRPVEAGETVEVHAESDGLGVMLKDGRVRLVDGEDLPVPTGSEQGVDEGEAVGTDADEPSADDDAQLDEKALLLDELEALGVEHDRRWGVKRLREARDAANAE